MLGLLTLITTVATGWLLVLEPAPSTVRGAEVSWPMGWSATGFGAPVLYDSGPNAVALGERALYVARGSRVVSYERDGDAHRVLGRSVPLPGVIWQLLLWPDESGHERFLLAVQEHAVWWLDLRDPFTPVPVAVLRTAGSVDVTVHEQRLFLLDGAALSIYDLDTDGQPVQIFQQPSSGTVVHAGNDRLYVLSNRQQLDVWDWDPNGDEPIRARGSLTLSVPAEDLAEAHGLLYSVDYIAVPMAQSLRVWRLSEAQAEGSSGLEVTELAGSPIYPEDWQYGSSSGMRLAIEGSRAFAYLNGVLAAFDLDDPEQPRREMVAHEEAWDLAIDADRVWLSSPAWIRRLDIADPTAVITTTWRSDLAWPRSVVAAEGRTVVGGDFNGLQVLDEEGVLESAGLGTEEGVSSHVFSVDGSRVAAAYTEIVGGGLGGLVRAAIALLNLDAPGTVIEFELEAPFADRLALHGDRLALVENLGNEWDVRLFDLAGGEGPREIASRSMGDGALFDTPAATWIDDRLWVAASLATGLTRLMALEPTPGGDLQRAMELDVPLIAVDIEWVGGYAFILGRTELLVIDLQVPGTARQVARVDLPARPVALARHEGLLVVAYSERGGRRSIRLSPEARPVNLNTWDGGALVFDISRPAVPVEVARAEVPFGLSGVAFDGDSMTLASTRVGLVRLPYVGPRADSPEGDWPSLGRANRLWLPWLERLGSAP